MTITPSATNRAAERRALGRLITEGARNFVHFLRMRGEIAAALSDPDVAAWLVLRIASLLGTARKVAELKETGAAYRQSLRFETFPEDAPALDVIVRLPSGAPGDVVEALVGLGFRQDRRLVAADWTDYTGHSLSDVVSTAVRKSGGVVAALPRILPSAEDTRGAGTVSRGGATQSQNRDEHADDEEMRRQPTSAAVQTNAGHRILVPVDASQPSHLVPTGIRRRVATHSRETRLGSLAEALELSEERFAALVLAHASRPDSAPKQAADAPSAKFAPPTEPSPTGNGGRDADMSAENGGAEPVNRQDVNRLPRRLRLRGVAGARRPIEAPPEIPPASPIASPATSDDSARPDTS